ncbi:MAG: MFS transporter [Gordonia sp. (in: high G+C Gram-positive bacteria)]
MCLFGTVASRYSGALVTRFGPLAVITAGTFVMLAGLALLLVPSLPVVVVGLIVFTIGCYTAHPTASGQTGIRAQLGRAQASALYQFAWLAGSATMGLVAGAAYDARGWSATVLVAAVMCVLASCAAHVLLRRRLRPPDAVSDARS